MTTGLLTIGELASRTGLAASAIRFYEAQGLITSTRTSGGQRRFERETLRRLAFIGAGRRVGLTLDELADALASLPAGRTPTPEDWAGLSARWRERLDAQLFLLGKLRDDLDSCIGCGCLSLERCHLYNPEDSAARLGPGARYLLGDRPEDAGERPAGDPDP